jgi:hypothetical protein
MRAVRASLSGMAVLLAAVTVAGAQADQDRRELMTLYFASIAADRCDFPLNEADADKLIQSANALQKKLGLKDEAADLLYEEVELAFEKKLPDACKKDGEAFKSYERVMEAIRKK